MHCRMELDQTSFFGGSLLFVVIHSLINKDLCEISSHLFKSVSAYIILLSKIVCISEKVFQASVCDTGSKISDFRQFGYYKLDSLPSRRVSNIRLEAVVHPQNVLLFPKRKQISSDVIIRIAEEHTSHLRCAQPQDEFPQIFQNIIQITLVLGCITLSNFTDFVFHGIEFQRVVRNQFRYVN
ncbi:Hypothetical_protein [Hexamita inflata]|uniref:Hypothetical_protein n=1 Tax=Hexamita inflata TaxID=28002 RepID=A0ABP1GKS1_9EUKA